MSELRRITNGPDARHGMGSCAKCGQHHSGVTSGFNDGCCCCDQCRYLKTWTLGTLSSARTDRLKNEQCCRCVPHVICLVFVPDDGESECCKRISVPMFPFSTTDPVPSIRYEGSIVNYQVRVTSRFDEHDQCVWRVRVMYETSSLDESYDFPVDHVNSTCLSFTDFELTGVTIPGTIVCTGTLRFGDYLAEKVPYLNRFYGTNGPIEPVFYNGTGPDVAIANSPCRCNVVAKVLCVTGRRHTDGDVESVEFVWDYDLGDRWWYVPMGGHPLNDRELIFLRGEEYGNGDCYLELDFEASGPWTNDWFDPPTFDGDVAKMVPIEKCACGLYVSSETTGERWVRIHAGPCERFTYRCGKCHCVPKNLCIIGEIDGETVSAIAVWDGDGQWDATFGEYGTNLILRLGKDSHGDCVVTVDDSAFAVELLPSAPISCDKYLMFEIESALNDLSSGGFNWLWATSNMCGCAGSSCGICAVERCGGPPKTIFVDLEAIGTPRMDNPLEYPTVCNLTVACHFYERWNLTHHPPVLYCGWIGYAAIPCIYGDFLLRVQYAPSEGGIFLTRLFPNGTQQSSDLNGSEMVQVSCDPFLFVHDWQQVAPFQQCFWGCEIITEIKITISE